MPDRDIRKRDADEWRPWHLSQLNGDTLRGPRRFHPDPVFRPVQPPLRPLRVGVAYHVFQSFDQIDDLQLLHVLLRQSPIHVFVIPVDGLSPPPAFERATYTKLRIDAVENWVEYSIRAVGNREGWHVRSAAGGKPVNKWLDIDDGPFRQRAGTPTCGPMALPTDEDSVAGAAFQSLVAKVLRCDLYITEAPDPFEGGGRSGYKFRTETVSPRAAVPLLGLYLRRLGRFRLDYDRRLGRRGQHAGYFSSGEVAVTFFRMAVRGMLGVTFNWSQLEGRAATPEGRQEFLLFADTVLHRLEQVLRERDRLLHLLAVAPGGIADGYKVADAFDAFLLLALAALDAMAEAINTVFGLRDKFPNWGRQDFLKKLPCEANGLARLFISEEQGGNSFRLRKVLSELRNSIHSEAISRMPLVGGSQDFAASVLLPLPVSRFTAIRCLAFKEGELEQWGIFEDVHGSGRAYLHPGEFVEMLTPRLFGLVHRIMVEVLRATEDAGDRSSASRPVHSFFVNERNALRLLGLERFDQQTS